MTEKFWIECIGQTYTALFVISSPSDLDEELFEWCLEYNREVCRKTRMPPFCEA